MERQKARWRHAGCANVREFRGWVLQMTLKKLSHFMRRHVYTDNFFYVPIAICHIKTNKPAFQHMQLSHKNWSFLIIYTGNNVANKNCSCRRGFSNVEFAITYHTSPLTESF